MLLTRLLRGGRIFAAAAAPILLICKQHNPYRMPRLIPDRPQRPQHLDRLHTPRPIIHRPLRRIPGIQMSAHRYILVREHRPLQLTDHIVRRRIRQHISMRQKRNAQIRMPLQQSRQPVRIPQPHRRRRDLRQRIHIIHRPRMRHIIDGLTHRPDQNTHCAILRRPARPRTPGTAPRPNRPGRSRQTTG